MACADISMSSGESLAKSLAQGSAQNIATTKPIVVTNVPKSKAQRNTSTTRWYFLAP